MTINQKLREMVSKLGIMNLAKEYGRKKQISKLTGKFLNYKQGQLIELPEEIVFEITGRCNLRCKMCYINFNQNKKDDVSKEDFIKIINKMPFLKKITLIGGEAFIRKDIFDILDYLEDKRIKFAISTNATMIMEKEVLKLKTYKNLLQINVSVDGNREIHDSIRGKGNFEKSLNAIRLLKKNNIFVGVTSVIMKENINDLKSIVKVLKDAGVDCMDFSYERTYTKEAIEQTSQMVQIDNTQENFPIAFSDSSSRGFSFEELGKAIDDVNQYARSINMPLSYQTFNLDKRLDEFYFWKLNGEHFCKHLFIARIDCQGNLIFCLYIKKPLGSLLEKSFEELWWGNEINKVRARIIRFGSKNLPVCKDCCKLICVEKSRTGKGRLV